METINQLKTFIGNSSAPFQVLGLKGYVARTSALHRDSPALVSLIDRKMRELKTDNVWKAIIHLVRRLPNVPRCKHCKGPLTFKRGYPTYCSAKCRANCPEYRTELEASLLRIHGVKSNLDLGGRKRGLKKAHSKEAFAKRDATNLERYGGNPAKNREVRERAEATLIEKYGSLGNYYEQLASQRKAATMERYGVDHYSKTLEYRKKYLKTCRERYGTDHPMKTEKVRSKLRKSNLKKYGVTHPMQTQEIFDKQQLQAMQRKRIRIQGRTFTDLQGYEPAALKFLDSEGIDLSRIEAHPKIKPVIKWKSADGKEHVYFPDFLYGKHIVEVKSTYTFNGSPETVEANKRKRRACLERGYHFTFLVRTGKTFKRITRRSARA